MKERKLAGMKVNIAIVLVCIALSVVFSTLATTALATSTYTLSVTSSNPNSGLSITASPSDNNGVSSGSTPFTLTYYSNTVVTLTAPGNGFQTWQQDGEPWANTPTTTLTMNGNHTITAVYGVGLATPCINGFDVEINGAPLPIEPLTSITWDWGDGQVTNEWSPAFHAYLSAGTYTVTMMCNYTNGSSASTSGTVTVAPGILSGCEALTISATDGGTASYLWSGNWSAWNGNWDELPGTVPNNGSVTLQWCYGGNGFLNATPSPGYSFSGWSASSGISIINGVPPISNEVEVAVGTNSQMTATFSPCPAIGLPSEVLYVENNNNTAGVNTILELNGGGTIVGTISNSLFNSLNALTSDRNGNLYVANYSIGTILEVTANGCASTFATRFDEPNGLAFDSGSNLYVANYGSGTISKVTPSGSVSTFATGFGGYNQEGVYGGPNGLAFDHNGNLYVSCSALGIVAKVTPAGIVSTFATGLVWPAGLALDSAGNLYVANQDGSSIAKVTPDGSVTTFASGITQPYQMAFDSSGNLYVSGLMSDGLISRITPNGEVSTFATGLNWPAGIVLGANFSGGTPPTYTLTISAGQGGSVLYVGDVGSVTVAAGTSATLQVSQGEQPYLTVTPAAGYRFASWSGSSGITDTNGAPIDPTVLSIYIVVNSDSQITASFCCLGTTLPNTPWAGYIVGIPDATGPNFQDGTVSDVKATWIVPHVGGLTSIPTFLDSAYTMWVGIGGYPAGNNSGSLVQIGIDRGAYGTPYAFFEFLEQNAAKTNSPLFSVHSGDTISAEVSYLGQVQNNYQLTITDVTLGVSTSVWINSSVNLRDSAEWIVENPDWGQNGGSIPLADIGVVNFNDCSVTLNSESYSINGDCQAEDVAISMNEGGEAQPIDLSSDGSSFAVESCIFTLSATSVTLPAKGGSKNVSVKVKGSDCAWTAVSNDPFITITAGSSGTGNGKVDYTVMGNTSTMPLTGTMTIAGQTFTVNQDAGGCTFKLSPKAGKIKAAGGSATVKATPNLSDCAWTAVSNDSFITITDGASGTGKGTVTYTVMANTNTTALTGSITIGGQTFIVTQAGAK